MKLILTAAVDNLGVPGDIVEVKNGYGRNYLLPLKRKQRALGVLVRLAPFATLITHAKLKSSWRTSLACPSLSALLTRANCSVLSP